MTDTRHPYRFGWDGSQEPQPEPVPGLDRDTVFCLVLTACACLWIFGGWAALWAIRRFV